MNNIMDVHSRQKSRTGNGKVLGKNELAEIYDQYHLPIYQFIYRQVGDVDVSRELSSEVFHRMLKQNQNGTDRFENPAPWLYRVARNLVIDHYRRQQHRNHSALNEELLESSHNTVEIAEIQIAAEKMRMALTKLTPDQRQVIVMKFMEGLSNQEVADALSKPVGAVKALQHRGLAALRHLLDPIEERIIA